ncbi:MAG: isoprenylcysteine carboxylmethyltransferase family protein [Nitrospinae bacterium]|nr:isoprenylcysteine carboxylmethyltransferase family protein [Nitrospinota bacterium]MBL7020825.1 isoprenylcysteine carboxylmethyltransferase family protein [Nitrospinaceae bacterium]
MKLSRSLLTAFLIFPLNVMGVIPALLIWCSRPGGVLEYFPYDFNSFRSLVGIVLVALGAGLCWKTVSLFTEVGGTPAPYDPPRKLVIEGPYIYVRNPMMVGVCLVLLGEALLFGSVSLAAWFLVFCGLCLVLIPFWEEPDLEKRFGEPYREYRRTAPRWIPKFLPDKNRL